MSEDEYKDLSERLAKIEEMLQAKIILDTLPRYAKASTLAPMFDMTTRAFNNFMAKAGDKVRRINKNDGVGISYFCIQDVHEFLTSK